MAGAGAPVAQIVALVRASGPDRAAALLSGLPADRLVAVFAALPPSDVARLLPAVPANQFDQVVETLGPGQLSRLAGQPSSTLVPLLAALPAERLAVVAAAIPDQALPAMLAELPERTRGALLSVLDPVRVRSLVSEMYGQEVRQALRRANASVADLPGAGPGVLLVHLLSWRFVVVPRYGDDGRSGLVVAEESVLRSETTAALAVVDLEPAPDVLRYCYTAQERGRLSAVARWRRPDDDGSLKRTLVGLCR